MKNRIERYFFWTALVVVLMISSGISYGNTVVKEKTFFAALPLAQDTVPKRTKTPVRNGRVQPRDTVGRNQPGTIPGRTDTARRQPVPTPPEVPARPNVPTAPGTPGYPNNPTAPGIPTNPPAPGSPVTPPAPNPARPMNP